MADSLKTNRTIHVMNIKAAVRTMLSESQSKTSEGSDPVRDYLIQCLCGALRHGLKGINEGQEDQRSTPDDAFVDFLIDCCENLTIRNLFSSLREKSGIAWTTSVISAGNASTCVAELSQMGIQLEKHYHAYGLLRNKQDVGSIQEWLSALDATKNPSKDQHTKRMSTKYGSRSEASSPARVYSPPASPKSKVQPPNVLKYTSKRSNWLSSTNANSATENIPAPADQPFPVTVGDEWWTVTTSFSAPPGAINRSTNGGQSKVARLKTTAHRRSHSFDPNVHHHNNELIKPLLKQLHRANTDHAETPETKSAPGSPSPDRRKRGGSLGDAQLMHTRPRNDSMMMTTPTIPLAVPVLSQDIITSSELAQENAHFDMSEALISAIEEASNADLSANNFPLDYPPLPSIFESGRSPGRSRNNSVSSRVSKGYVNQSFDSAAPSLQSALERISNNPSAKHSNVVDSSDDSDDDLDDLIAERNRLRHEVDVAKGTPPKKLLSQGTTTPDLPGSLGSSATASGFGSTLSLASSASLASTDEYNNLSDYPRNQPRVRLSRRATFDSTELSKAESTALSFLKSLPQDPNENVEHDDTGTSPEEVKVADSLDTTLVQASTENVSSYTPTPQRLNVSFTDVSHQEESETDGGWVDVDVVNSITEARKPTRLRGDMEWAPPRQQIVFTLTTKPRNQREALAKQSNRCAGCGLAVDPAYVSRYRYCDYLGKYFCASCHSKESSFIPAKILWKWDFKKSPVSNFSKDIINTMLMETPLFNVQDINPDLYNKVRNLVIARQTRVQLSQIYQYLELCTSNPKILREFKSLPHIYTDVDLYSLEELVGIRDGGWLAFLQQLVEKGVRHIRHCQPCLAKGFVCEICRSEDVIFRFEDAVAYTCPECNGCFHRRCWARQRANCPRCERFKKYKKIREN